MGDVARRRTEAKQRVRRYKCPTCSGHGHISVNRDQRDALRLIADRVKFGIKKYGHGLEVDSGYNWPREALEEIADCIQYVMMSLIGIARSRRGNGGTG